MPNRALVRVLHLHLVAAHLRSQVVQVLAILPSLHLRVHPVRVHLVLAVPLSQVLLARPHAQVLAQAHRPLSQALAVPHQAHRARALMLSKVDSLCRMLNPLA